MPTSNHTTQISLTKGYVATVDSIDSDLSLLKWHAIIEQNTVYARKYKSKIKGRKLFTWMHRVILERILDRPLLDEEKVDHVDGNGLNNRRENLRLATFSQNGANRRISSNNTSGYKGVTFKKAQNRWQARFTIHGKCKHLGIFDTPEEAHKAYCEAMEKHYGEFARPE